MSSNSGKSFGDHVSSAFFGLLRWVVIVAFIGGMFWFWGNMGGGRPVGGWDDNSYEPEYVEPRHEPPPREIPRQPQQWRCWWEPTMNENWYDDVLCQRGLEVHRPELLTDWDFVTREDMEWAAQEYADWLNSQP